ncbi:MAG: endonuclease MutS2 [Bacteroidota bacterium]
MHTYPDSIEDKLGFTLVRRRLGQLVKGPLGEERLEGMRPARSREWLDSELQRVHEAQEALRYDRGIPLQHVHDVRGTLRKARPEDAYVSAEALHAVRQILVTGQRLSRYFADRRQDYPSLQRSTRRIDPLTDLEAHLGAIIDDDGSIRDDASDALLRIRRQIRERQSALRTTLNRELRKAIGKGYATEDQPTLRAGRMVIPIRAEAKRKVDGFIHDTSATGQTVYIEPAACLQLNNEVSELKADERNEIERILRAATSRVRQHIASIETNLQVLGQFDLLQAKARMANEIEAHVPNLNDEGHVKLEEARNAALVLHRLHGDSPESDEPVVPLSLELGRDFTTLVITGPNAGGKTVAMKTVGLCSLMTTYGLPIPAAPHSTVPLWSKIIVDIGDEQSIEDDLSTFSSHVANLRHMMRQATPNTLVLIDEAGTGTDPEAGGALAQALLERLTKTGVRTMATTHHGALKAYAYEADDVENGSMVFDQETLAPTYQYQQGVPGSSYAFEIAERMGLDTGLLDRARSLAGEQMSALEDLVKTFETRTQKLEKQVRAAEEAKRRAQSERERMQQKRTSIEKEREEYRQQALEEAERIVNEANARVERTIREIKEAEAERQATKEARERLEAYKKEVHERNEEEQEASADESNDTAPSRRQSGTDEVPASSDGAPPQEPIQEGDQVVVDNGSTKVEVLELEDNEALVGSGPMHMRVPLHRLTRVGGARSASEQTSSYSSAPMTALEASHRIDLRGERVEEALLEVQHFVDDAVAAGLNQVEILHGKGTGALREAIHDQLRERSDVAHFDIAPIEEGGSGVTHVTLAQ